MFAITNKASKCTIQQIWAPLIKYKALSVPSFESTEKFSHYLPQVEDTLLQPLPHIGLQIFFAARFWYKFELQMWQK